MRLAICISTLFPPGGVRTDVFLKRRLALKTLPFGTATQTESHACLVAIPIAPEWTGYMTSWPSGFVGFEEFGWGNPSTTRRAIMETSVQLDALNEYARLTC